MSLEVLDADTALEMAALHHEMGFREEAGAFLAHWRKMKAAKRGNSDD